jgi:hypothetical protein
MTTQDIFFAIGVFVCGFGYGVAAFLFLLVREMENDAKHQPPKHKQRRRVPPKQRPV